MNKHKNMATRKITHLYLYPVYGTLIVIVFAFAYIYIYSRHIAGRNRVDPGNNRQSRRNNFIPLWIVISFIVFIVIPYIIYTILFYALKMDRKNNYMYQIISIVFLLNYAADPLVYIFCQPCIRNKFLLLVGWQRASQRNDICVLRSDIPNQCNRCN